MAYTFEGNYPEAFDTLDLINLAGKIFFECDKATIPNQITLDFNRFHMIGSAQDYNSLKMKWSEARKTLNDYWQGDMCGGLFTTPAFFTRFCSSPADEALLAKQNAVETQTHVHDAYIDENGNACNISITAHPHHPEKWMIAIVRNADKNPAQRRVHLLSTVHTLPKKSAMATLKNAKESVSNKAGVVFSKAKSYFTAQPYVAKQDEPTVPNNQVSQKRELQEWLQNALGNPKIYNLLQNVFSPYEGKEAWKINIAALQVFANVTHRPNPFRGTVGNRVDFIRATLSDETILRTERSMKIASALDRSKPFPWIDLENLTPTLHKTLSELTGKLGLRLKTFEQWEDWPWIMQDELLTLFSIAGHQGSRPQDRNRLLKNKETCLKNLVEYATIPQPIYQLLSQDERAWSDQLVRTLRQMMVTKEASQHARQLAANFKRPRKRPVFQAHQTKFETQWFAYLLDDLAKLDQQAKALTKRKATVMGRQLGDLHELLNRNLSMIFAIPYTALIDAHYAKPLADDLLAECKTALKNVDPKLLDQHRGVKRILQNLLVSILLVGVIWLAVVAVRYFVLKKSGKESFQICNPTTDSRRLFNTIKQTVDDIFIPGEGTVHDGHYVAGDKFPDLHHELFEKKPEPRSKTARPT